MKWGIQMEVQESFVLVHITQLENAIHRSDTQVFWIPGPLSSPGIASLCNNSFKNTELSVSRKGTYKAFTGAKSREKKNLRF